MDAIQVYALLNKKIKGLTSGIQSAVVNGTDIVFTMHDGTSTTMSFPTPEDGEDGTSVTNMEIDANGHLIAYYGDGTSNDCGLIPTVSGDVQEFVKDEVTTQIETQLDDTIQEKVDKAVEEALKGDSSTGDVESEINSWF